MRRERRGPRTSYGGRWGGSWQATGRDIYGKRRPTTHIEVAYACLQPPASRSTTRGAYRLSGGAMRQVIPLDSESSCKVVPPWLF